MSHEADARAGQLSGAANPAHDHATVVGIDDREVAQFPAKASLANLDFPLPGAVKRPPDARSASHGPGGRREAEQEAEDSVDRVARRPLAELRVDVLRIEEPGRDIDGRDVDLRRV